ncbi:MAG: hypothetical protein R3B47_09440 [Bacteroidia bacterium]
MKQLFWLVMAVLVVGCSDQIKQERTFSGVVKRASTDAPRGSVLVSAYQDNGKEFPKNALEVDNAVTDESGAFSLTIMPFNNTEASDVRILAQVSEYSAFSGGIAEFVYTIADEVFSKNQVLEQSEDQPIMADLLTPNYSILTLTFTLGGTGTAGWQGNLRIFNDNFSHNLSLSEDDFMGIYKFPVDAGEEFTIQLSGLKDSGRIEVEETFSIAAPSGAEGEAPLE